jgi:multidrug efflux system outer membrane protein
VSARVAAVLVAGMLTGCAAVLSAPPAPTLQVAPAWRSAVGPGAGVVEAGWWSRFDDPVLNALVTDALRENGDLRIARAHVAEFAARGVATHAARLPAVDVQAQPARTRFLNGAGQPVVDNILSAGFQASYEIDIWGRLARADDAALADYQAERASAEAVALSIAANVATAYQNLRGLDAQYALAQATLALRRQSRDLARQQFATGYSSQLELTQAESEYDASDELLPQLQHAIRQQENALALLAGRSPGPIARGRSLDELTPPVVPAGLPSDLLQRRPDLVRAAATVRAQTARAVAARDGSLPSFKLTATGGVQAFDAATLLNAPTALWNLAAHAAAPLYDRARLQAQTTVAGAQRDIAVYAYEQAVRSALADTETSLDAIDRLQQQLAPSNARRAAAAAAFRIARSRHAGGYASFLEELDAQRTLFTADLGLVQLRTRRLVAAVDLYRALGGGWSGAALQ